MEGFRVQGLEIRVEVAYQCSGFLIQRSDSKI